MVSAGVRGAAGEQTRQMWGTFPPLSDGLPGRCLVRLTSGLILAHHSAEKQTLINSDHPLAKLTQEETSPGLRSAQRIPSPSTELGGPGTPSVMWSTLTGSGCQECFPVSPGDVV